MLTGDSVSVRGLITGEEGIFKALTWVFLQTRPQGVGRELPSAASG